MSVLDSIRAQFASVDTPLMQAARSIQGLLASSPAATTTGSGPAAAPGEADHAAARAAADATLASIDWSKRDVVLWVPATGSHAVPAGWKREVQRASSDGDVGTTLMDYPASLDFHASVATGAETLRLTLEGIQARGGNHRVMLSGHSQGAWVISDALQDPQVRSRVERAVVFGRPSEAASAGSGSDDKLRVINDPDDPFTEPTSGIDQGFEGVSAVLRNGRVDWKSVAKVGVAALANPFLGAYLIGRKVAPDAWSGERDPHHYNAEFASGARYLTAS